MFEVGDFVKRRPEHWGDGWARFAGRNGMDFRGAYKIIAQTKYKEISLEGVVNDLGKECFWQSERFYKEQKEISVKDLMEYLGEL